MSLCFEIFGIRISLESQDGEIEKRIGGLLSTFACLENAHSEKSRDLRLFFFRNPPQSLKEKSQALQKTANPLYYCEQMSVYQKEMEFLYTDGHSFMIFSRENHTLQGFISARTLEQDVFFENTFFLYVLFDMLALHQLFLLHAAALTSKQGRFLLFPALSRQGKTTITLSLMRAGFLFFSDDLLFLSPQGNLHDFPRDFHVDPALANSFVELAFLANKAPYFRHNPKRKLSRAQALNLYPQSRGPATRTMPQADFLIFPSIVPLAQSHFFPLSKGEALAHLLPASALITVNREKAGIHLECLKKLVESAQCYAWKLGKDLLKNPQDIPFSVNKMISLAFESEEKYVPSLL